MAKIDLVRNLGVVAHIECHREQVYDTGAFDVVLSTRGSSTRPAWRTKPVAALSQKPYATDPRGRELKQQMGARLRAHLLTKLPEHMTPSAFVILDRMPLTSSGKTPP